MKFYNLIYPKGCKKSAAYLASNGCGADGALFDLVPDNFLGVDISEACKIHDYCYSIGGTEKDRELADRMFRSNLRTCVLNDDSLIFRSTNLKLCELYYIAVHRFGHASFNFTT